MNWATKGGIALPLPGLVGEGTRGVSSTFVSNMSLPLHGWFRFSAGFSAEWARRVVEEEKESRDDIVLLDPFAGVGTAVLAAEEAGVPAYGLEAQPFIARVAGAKLLWHISGDKFVAFANAVLRDASGRLRREVQYPPLIHKCYPYQVIQELDSLKCAWEEASDGSPASELAWLALVAILRVCSPVGTAPWQYVLPRKSKNSVVAPYRAFAIQVERMACDMAFRQSQGIQPRGRVFLCDARPCSAIADNSISLVVTSPPYTNNYDYADATRLEMTFLGEVAAWGDLHETARRHLIRSCSQHVSTERLDLDDILGQFSVPSLLPELTDVCSRLALERLGHGGKKDYHVMIAAYFADMALVWRSLRRVCKPGARVCFVVGDSAPYGVYVPVDRWLGELALAAGFRCYRFEKLRDRNVKWRNRKHRVPLHEGHLWVEG